MNFKSAIIINYLFSKSYKKQPLIFTLIMFGFCVSFVIILGCCKDCVQGNVRRFRTEHHNGNLNKEL